LTKVTVAVEGWNAEAAVSFALVARKFASSVALTSSRETVDGKDEIEVLTLGPGPGEEVVMAVDGRDEKEAFDTLLAELLGVIEPQKDRTAAVNGPDTASRKKTATPRRRRIAEIAALDVEEVAPVHYRKRMGGKRVHRKQEPKSGRKPTTTRRTPRKRKK
jgi:phosphotransferase system HPr (HPr) family protein